VDSRIAKLAGASALDIGCAAGFSPRRWRGAGEGQGITFPTGAEVAQLHLHGSKLAVDYEAISARISRALTGAYDVVTCMSCSSTCPIREHRARLFPARAKRRTRVLLDDQPHLKSYLLAVIGAEYVLSCSQGTHDYAKFVKPSSCAHCRDAGLSVREMTGMTYNRSPGSTRSGRHRCQLPPLLRAR